MKTSRFILFAAIFLSLIVFSDCQKEEFKLDKDSVSLQADGPKKANQPIDISLYTSEAKGGSGMGMGGDSGSEPIYRVEYHGALSGVAYGQATQDNKKAQVIGAGACETFTITGIPGLVGLTCFESPLVNIWGPTVRLIDRRIAEEDMRASIRLFISYEGSNHWVNFIGSLCCDPDGLCVGVGIGNGCSERSSILPTAKGESNAVWIRFDRMIVETIQEGCSTDIWFENGEDVRVEIQLVDTADCS